MTRIIAGIAGSLTLQVPGIGTRPTADRVREAVFSSLEARDAIADAHVLDLFAGSGALGLEALSRGAATVVLVERNARAAQVCRSNARAVMDAIGTAGAVTVTQSTVGAYLDANPPTTDLVFIDPPYQLAEGELAAVLTAVRPRLNAAALVVVERSAKSPEPTWPTGLTPLTTKKYGDTAVFVAQATTESEER